MRHIARSPLGHGGTPGPERSPGLLVVAAAGVAFVVCIANFALGEAHAGVAAATVGMLAFGGGLSWISMDRRRIRDSERHWPMSHPAR